MATFTFVLELDESELAEIDQSIWEQRAAGLTPVPPGGWPPLDYESRLEWLLETLRYDLDYYGAKMQGCYAVAGGQQR